LPDHSARNAGLLAAAYSVLPLKTFLAKPPDVKASGRIDGVVTGRPTPSEARVDNDGADGKLRDGGGEASSLARSPPTVGSLPLAFADRQGLAALALRLAPGGRLRRRWFAERV
jgi:hypothetical protein